MTTRVHSFRLPQDEGGGIDFRTIAVDLYDVGMPHIIAHQLLGALAVLVEASAEDPHTRRGGAVAVGIHLAHGYPPEVVGSPEVAYTQACEVFDVNANSSFDTVAMNPLDSLNDDPAGQARRTAQFDTIRRAFTRLCERWAGSTYEQLLRTEDRSKPAPGYCVQKGPDSHWRVWAARRMWAQEGFGSEALAIEWTWAQFDGEGS